MEKRSSTIGELMERRRILDGAKEYKGHTYLDLARFDENTKHMIIFDAIDDDSSPHGGHNRTRLFLTDEAYEEALKRAEQGEIEIVYYASVINGYLVEKKKKRKRHKAR
mgnify:CR=1 FL=1